jgi:hypothetical protein
MIDVQTIPHEFSVVHMSLAREPAHPEGSAFDGYVAVLPLQADGRLDVTAWRAHPELCRVSHMSPHGVPQVGMLDRNDEGEWIFDFGQGGQPERGFRFGSEHFRAGEYVSLIRDGEEHTYRVVSLRPLDH